jgi:hypothetical protein
MSSAPEAKVEMDSPFSPRWDRLNMRLLLHWERYYPRCPRIEAIKALLCRLQPPELSKLEELNREHPLYWFLPCRTFHGMCEWCPDGRMIYMHQYLDLLSDHGIVGAAAHELAHYMQGHLDVPGEGRGYTTTEKDADDTASAWGFAAEITAMHDETVKLDGIIRREVPRFLAAETAPAN